MKQVKSFQTSDSKLFTDKVAALKHEFGLEIRGLIQTGNNFPQNKDCYTASQIADILVKNAPEVTKIIGKYRSQITVAAKNQINPIFAKFEE